MFCSLEARAQGTVNAGTLAPLIPSLVRAGMGTRSAEGDAGIGAPGPWLGAGLVQAGMGWG